jgi:hypothetical protein
VSQNAQSSPFRNIGVPRWPTSVEQRRLLGLQGGDENIVQAPPSIFFNWRENSASLGPLANRFTIHILAAVAEYEERLIPIEQWPLSLLQKREAGNSATQSQKHRFSDAARTARVGAERERSKRRALNFASVLCQLTSPLQESGRLVTAMLGVTTLCGECLSTPVSENRIAVRPAPN